MGIGAALQLTGQLTHLRTREEACEVIRAKIQGRLGERAPLNRQTRPAQLTKTARPTDKARLAPRTVSLQRLAPEGCGGPSRSSTRTAQAR
jgi:hypothetical protein